MEIITKYNCKFSIPVESIGRMDLQDISDWGMYKPIEVLTKVDIEFFDGTLMSFVLLKSEMRKFAEEYKRTHKWKNI